MCPAMGVSSGIDPKTPHDPEEDSQVQDGWMDQKHGC